MAVKKKKSVEGSAGSTVVTLDFTKDESEGRKRFKEGDYTVKVKGIKMGHSEQKGTPFVQLTLVFKEGKYTGEVIRDRCYITDKALWRIRAVFKAAGVEIPKKKMKIDFKDLVGETLGITVSDEEYEDNNGKARVTSRVTDYIDPSDIEEDEDDEDEDDEEEDEDEDLEDMDVDEDM